MGLPPSVEHFDISFIKRTSKNLKKYHGKFEFTMLLNSLLGLIVVPQERKDKKGIKFDFLTKKLADSAELHSIFSRPDERVLKDGKEINQKKFLWLSKKGNERPVGEVKLDDFLTRMRHGIAHFGVTPLAKPEKTTEWCGIILRNIDNGTTNFEVCLMEDEIRVLSLLIASEYRKAVILSRRKHDDK